MKKIIFSVGLILISISTYAKSVSESHVPALVKNSFHKDYPKAEHVKWEVTEVNDFKASFRTGDEYANVFYDSNGGFIESDITVEWKEVPLTGRMEVYHLNNKGHITSVLKIVNSKGQKFYQVDVKRNLKHYEILLDQEGNIMN